ncbi:unnamed protein product (macronuclear) [Paramecium tetraurelia]|uniref:BTB domain-containing protein n=1 Tax=Paramecium tetraurelia TaxID=5888 RepID=A0CPK9_PARTE|nr:uncharacterized protein GSPATT00009118001 [Paramecium tetraurelia]CAK72726.1 unnamed protein product [Paramecium tetraurelia]|eukprot:XP_001440123.1 hypothetical protein (macronuclear) [Paramecium tetraurelia strain d4-2]
MSWITIGSQNKGPQGRWGHTSVAQDDKLYIFGGYDGNYLNDFYSYDFDNNMWQTIHQEGQVPEPRSNHIMLINSGTIYIQGGGGMSKTRFGDLYSFNNKTWLKQKINLIPRTYHTGCVGDNKLFIYGGESGRDLDDLEIVDLSGMTQYTVKVECQVKPEPRRFATLQYYNNQLILIGGCTQSYINTPSIYVASFKEVDNNISVAWTQLQIQFSKWGQSCIQFDDLLYIFGGRDDKDSDELYSFDLQNSKIQIINNQNKIKARRKHSASIIGNSLVIFGGFNGKYQNDLCFYELPLINSVPLSVELPSKPYQEVPQYQFENFFQFENGIHFYKEKYDCLIQTDEKCFGVNKSVLLNTSGYFRELFSGDYAEGQLLQLDLSFVDHIAFGIVLIFSYENKLTLPILNKEELFRLLELCDYLDMMQLKEKTQYYIAQTVDKNTIQEIYKLSVEHQNNQLQNFCAFKVSKLKMPLQEIDNIQSQQVNNMKKIRKLSIVNEL